MAVELVSRSSDVRISEIDLSQIILAAGGTVGVVPIVSTQGRTTPLLFTNGTDFIAEYGNPSPAISQTIQTGLNYFTKGNRLWGLRVAGTGATYGGLLMYVTVGGTIDFRTITFSDPSTVSPAAFALAGEQAVSIFYGLRGPGSYVANLSLSVSIPIAVAPTGFAAVSASTGGTLGPATYDYHVSALSLDGESLASTPIAPVIAAGVTNTISLSWSAVPSAVGYRVYGRTTGGLGLLTTVGGATLSFTDTGSLTADVTKQPILVSGGANSSPNFTVYVWDNQTPAANYLEQWSCTLEPSINAAGMQTEIANRINPFSGYLQVINNTTTLGSAPTMNAVPLTAMAAGNSGTAVTSNQVVAALQVFKDNQLYKTNLYMNGGIADPVTQQGMDSLCQGRGDSVALLDVPSSSQAYQAAIDYRNLTLNLNSTYSALFNPDLLIPDLINGQQLYVPPSGYVGALCAHTDATRNPAYSIAGLNRGVVNVLKQRYTFDSGQADALYQAQVNYFRTFVGQGIALWEQRTLSGKDSALSWLSVRRILCTLKVALYNFLLYALEEQNTDTVRRQLVNSCNSYLDTLVNSSAIASYRVQCDANNNPAAAVNAGILVLTIVIIPQIPIHEIQLQLVISKQGVSFSEALSQVNGQ
jgi:hypothetical protein